MSAGCWRWLEGPLGTNLYGQRTIQLHPGELAPRRTRWPRYCARCSPNSPARRDAPLQDPHAAAPCSRSEPCRSALPTPVCYAPFALEGGRTAGSAWRSVFSVQLFPFPPPFSPGPIPQPIGQPVRVALHPQISRRNPQEFIHPLDICRVPLGVYRMCRSPHNLYLTRVANDLRWSDA